MELYKDHPWVGASSIILNDEGKILLMKRAEQCSAFPGCWGLVGGFLDWGETAEEGLKREAEEEIGVELTDIKFIGRYYNTPHPSKKIVIALPHRATIKSGTPKPNQPEECSEVKWLDPSDIREMELAYDHKQILQDEGLI